MRKITLILHNIRSTHNVGSIFRTAEGLGIERIIISGYTPYPISKYDDRLPHIAAKLTSQIHKTALGAEAMVPFELVADIKQWISQFPYPVYALEQTKTSLLLDNFHPSDEFALLLGEEVDGVDSQLLELCNKSIEIPMAGKKESFNVSVACGIALYVLSR